MTEVLDRPPGAETQPRLAWRRVLAGRWSVRIALGVLAVVLSVTVAGPWVAPHDASEIVGGPFTPPGAGAPLGLDYLGSDVLSRLLTGGRSVVVLATLATALGYSIGLAAGLIAGMTRGWLDGLIMRTADVLLAFPAMVLVLLLVAGIGTGRTALILGIALLHVPYVARIIRSVTLDVSVRGYVEAAFARGEPLRTILRRDVLPNISGPIVADAGPRLTVSILLVAGLSFLGLGLKAPAADWALMVSENRSGLTIQPWAVLAPVLCIAALTVAVNVLADALARALGYVPELEVSR